MYTYKTHIYLNLHTHVCTSKVIYTYTHMHRWTHMYIHMHIGEHAHRHIWMLVFKDNNGLGQQSSGGHMLGQETSEWACLEIRKPMSHRRLFSPAHRVPLRSHGALKPTWKESGIEKLNKTKQKQKPEWLTNNRFFFSWCSRSWEDQGPNAIRFGVWEGPTS